MRVMMSFLMIFTFHSLAGECINNFNIGRMSEFRTVQGFTPINNPSINIGVNRNCQNYYIFAWGAYNISTSHINEIDIGAGLQFNILNNKNKIKVGFAKWIYQETNEYNDILTSELQYNELPVSIVFNINKLINDKGIQATIAISKNFYLHTIKEYTVETTPYLKTTYLDKFFGVSGRSNDIYGIKLKIKKGNFFTDISLEKHDGHKNLSDSTYFGIGFSYNFTLNNEDK